jgi:hypothetical protein
MVTKSNQIVNKLQLDELGLPSWAGLKGVFRRNNGMPNGSGIAGLKAGYQTGKEEYQALVDAKENAGPAFSNWNRYAAGLPVNRRDTQDRYRAELDLFLKEYLRKANLDLSDLPNPKSKTDVFKYITQAYLRRNILPAATSGAVQTPRPPVATPTPTVPAAPNWSLVPKAPQTNPQPAVSTSVINSKPKVSLAQAQASRANPPAPALNVKPGEPIKFGKEKIGPADPRYARLLAGINRNPGTTNVESLTINATPVTEDQILEQQLSVQKDRKLKLIREVKAMVVNRLKREKK